MAKKPDTTPDDKTTPDTGDLGAVNSTAPTSDDQGSVTESATTTTDHGKLPPLAKFHKFKGGK